MNVDTVSDAFAQKTRCCDYLRGMVTVTHKLFIPLGPRAYEAEVELSYSGQYPLEFVSQVTWPSGEDYTPAIRRGILDALRERGEGSIGGTFTLHTVGLHPVYSCEHAFFLAAREATCSILRLLKRSEKT